MRAETFRTKDLRLVEKRLNDILRDASPEDIFDIKFACTYNRSSYEFTYSVIVIFKGTEGKKNG